ncbi:MAG: 30S ribosomal protein S8 [Candidatus Kerfeldbacteria bacterium]|nr:30S ribosomal protein S8 [Candidatus Kerfeldbacteria bacterium]
MTDPIADMLTRIRNANRLHKPEVQMPYSKARHAIAEILAREGFVADVKKIDDRFGSLNIHLKYDDGGRPVLRSLRRVSKPGRRVYAKRSELPVVLSNTGIAILSTSSGIMTNKEAKQKGVGGEILCEIF